MITESEFIERVNIIAESYNCRTVLIDPDARIINIEGPEDQQVKCANALIDIFEKYEVEGGGIVVKEDVEIQQLKEGVGWAI